MASRSSSFGTTSSPGRIRFLLSAMPVESLQLGQAQPAEEWESGIRRLAKGRAIWTREQFAQALGQWKTDGWVLKQVSGDIGVSLPD